MLGVFTQGQRVNVYPHGSPMQGSGGSVVLISENQRAIAVRFDSMPPFAFGPKMPQVGFHPLGIVMLAQRFEIGPWIELAGGGHYEIEAEVVN